MAVWSKARVCGRLLSGAAVSNTAGTMDVCVVSNNKRQNAGKSRKETSTDEVKNRVQ